MADLPIPQTASETLQFLHRFAGDEVYVSARAISPDKKNTIKACFRITDSMQIDQFVAENSGTNNSFFKARLTKSPRKNSFKNEDAEIVTFAFADIDVAKPGCPATTEEALEFLRELPLPPSFLMASGSGGIHAGWLLKHPLHITDASSRSVAQKFLENVQRWVDHHGKTLRGYEEFDSMADLARIHRAPYSLNLKSGAGGLCKPILITDAAYAVDEFQSQFELLPETGPTRQVSTKTLCSSTLTKLLQTADAEWFQEKASKAGKPKANPAAIFKSCAFMRNAADKAATLPEPHWHHALNVISHAQDGPSIAHEMSRPHPRYDQSETDHKLHRFRDETGPTSCDVISNMFDGCKSCPFRDRISSPAELGNRTSDHADLLSQYIYIQSTRSFLNVTRPNDDGVDGRQFSDFYADRRLSHSADKALLTDPLFRKAEKRVYQPDRPNGLQTIGDEVVFNTYHAPKHSAGCSKLAEKFTTHIDYLIPNEAERDHLLNYLAHIVQKPWIKIPFAIALVGPQGTGKSYLFELMKKVIGDSNVNVCDGAYLNSNFNGHFAGSVLLGLEEVEIDGRAESYNRAKTLITNPTRQFERKFKNPEELPTPRAIILLMNDKYGLYLPDEGERRFSVLTTASQKQPPQYYKALFDFEPAYVAGVYDLLMNMDLSNFEPHAGPLATNAKNKMAQNSKSEVDLVVQNLMDARGPCFEHDIQKFSDIADAVNERLLIKSGSKPIKRALEAQGCVSDDRQCRLKSGERVRFWLIRNAEAYANLTPVELARAYENRMRATEIKIAS